MAKGVLIVYEPLSEVKEKKNYWQNHVSFYEKYWDVPSTPKSTWFGREYIENLEERIKSSDIKLPFTTPLPDPGRN